MNTKQLFIGIMLLLTIQTGNSQESYRVDNTSSTITITGTSNLHDWEMSASGMSAAITIKKGSQKAHNISKVDFSLPAKNIKSSSSIMDRKTWDAIKSDKYTDISFSLDKIEESYADGNNMKGIANGTLHLAGASKTISVPFSGKIQKDNTVTIEGSKEINLIEFNIEPPTAIMGTLKTGEVVTVFFNLNFVSDQAASAQLSR